MAQSLQINGRGQHRSGFSMTAMVCVLIGVPVMIVRWEVFRDGLWSFHAGIYLLITEPARAAAAFNAELLDYWIASLSLAVWIVGWSFRIHKRETVNGSSPWKESLQRLGKNRVVLMATVILMLFTLAAVWSPLIAPHHPNYQQDLMMTRFRKPMASVQYIRLKEQKEDENAAAPLIDRWIAINRKLMRPSTGVVYISGFVSGDSLATLEQGLSKKEIPLALLQSQAPEEQTFLLGTDKYGRDILSRIIYGARISLSIGLAAMVIAVIVGSLVGVSAGYFGGWTDRLLMRSVDLILAFPGLFLILLIVAIFGNSLLWLILILGMTGWMGVARLVRGQILSLKEQEFILAAEALGFTRWRIIFRHLLPNAFSPVIVAASLRIGTIILIEAGLSFLGLGVQPPTASWGNMINEGRDTLLFAWWISTMPGLAIVAVVTCFNVIGDGLRDALDPRLRN